MIHLVKRMLTRLSARIMLQQRSSRQSENPESATPSEDCPKAQRSRQLIFRVINAWDPEYIALACPLVSCTLIGPYGINVLAALAHERSTIYLDMLKLVLERIGTYWDIGSAALRTYSPGVRCECPLTCWFRQNWSNSLRDTFSEQIECRLTMLGIAKAALSHPTPKT